MLKALLQNWNLTASGLQLRCLAACGFLALTFLSGGGSRGDISSLPALRACSAVVFGAGLATLPRSAWQENRGLFLFAAACTALPLLQLVPLPHSVWTALPGRSLISGIDSALGLGALSRPLSMDPPSTRNAFWSLIVPLAFLSLVAGLEADGLRRVMKTALALGLASGFMGILQVVGDPQGPLYFYAVTNNGSAVGLFANRNHQALMLACTLTAMAIWVRSRNASAVQSQFVAETFWRSLTGIALALLMVPLILVTGSRSGLGLGLAALAFYPWLTRSSFRSGPSTSPKHPAYRIVIALVLLVGVMILATIWAGRDVAIDRALGSSSVSEMRILILPTLLAMIRLYVPLGTGMGTFDPVYRIHEPDELLTPSYMNHAHNDWLEVVFTGGLPAMVLLAIASGWFVIRSGRLLKAHQGNPMLCLCGRVSMIWIALMAAASVTDYPLRTPIFMALIVLAARQIDVSARVTEGKSQT